MKNNLIISKNIDKINRKALYVLSFLLPVFLMILIYIIKGIYPFGDRAFLRMDLYHQYLPFHAELQYKLQNFKSLLFTHDVGLGTNFISLFAYYLSCPFNILLFFVSKKYVIDFLAYITIIKIGLSSLSFSYYLIKKYNKSSILVVMFSIFYAMSGYMAAYYWNVMWLNNVVLLPLLLLGFEDVFNKKDGRLYIITLGLSILCNYYIATLTCFFLIFYFIFLIIITNQNKIKAILSKLLFVIIYSIVGILISAILLIPIFMAFSSTASNDFSFPKSIYDFFSIFDVISRHLPFVKIENGVDHFPNIYCGILILPITIYYFLSKKIDLKKKIGILVMIFVFYMSFSINIVNFILHVFRYPNSLPARFSFIYIFMMLVVSYVAIKKIEKIDKSKMLISFSISLFLIVLMQSVVENEKIKFYSFILSIIFLIVYLIIILCFYNKNINKYVKIGVLLFVVAFEAFINMYVVSITTVNRTDYVKKVESSKNLKKYVDSITNDYYRIEMNKRKTKDEGAFLNYPSASIFSSSCYEEGSDFYEKLGMEASMNAYSITGSTPFADSLLNVKYEFFDEEIENAKDLNMVLLNQNENLYLYEKLDTLPLSFVLNDKFIEEYKFGSGNPATAQNNFARSFDKKILMEPLDIDADGIEANFTIEKDGDYYAFVLDKSINEVTYQYKDKSKKFDNTKRGYFLELGYLQQGEKCCLRNDSNEKNMLVQVFRFRYDNLKNLVNRIKEDSDYNMLYHNDTYIKYDLDVKVKGKTMISIPYDEGWSIYVDGNEVEKQKILECFLGFDVDKGMHTIELKYMPRGLIVGSILSIIGVVLFIIYLFCYYNKKSIFDKKIINKVQ